MNHDALFKMLLKNRSILRAFFEQFLPEAARFIDFGQINYVDKEGVTLDGRKRTGDLLVKTRFRGKMAGFLIRLEHQAQRAADLPWRMLEYLVIDRRKYRIPVYPIAVLSHEEPDSRSRVPLLVDFPNKRVLEFDYDVVDLGRLDARMFLRIRNPAALALAARMRFDAKERYSLVRDFFINLAAVSVDREEQELVAGFFSAYQPLSREERLKLQQETATIEPIAMREKVMHLTNPFIELGREQGIQQGMEQGIQQGVEQGIQQGVEQGIEKGRHEGEIELVLRQLSRLLGVVPPSRKKQIEKLDLPKIEALGESLLDFKSPADLSRWLKKNAS